jgi:hypothetical protein
LLDVGAGAGAGVIVTRRWLLSNGEDELEERRCRALHTKPGERDGAVL